MWPVKADTLPVFAEGRAAEGEVCVRRRCTATGQEDLPRGQQPGPQQLCDPSSSVTRPPDPLLQLTGHRTVQGLQCMPSPLPSAVPSGRPPPQKQRAALQPALEEPTQFHVPRLFLRSWAWRRAGGRCHRHRAAKLSVSPGSTVLQPDGTGGESVDSREGSVHQGTHGNMGNSCHVGLGALWASSWAARRDAADALQGAGRPLPQSHSAALISAVVAGPCSRQTAGCSQALLPSRGHAGPGRLHTRGDRACEGGGWRGSLLLARPQRLGGRRTPSAAV